ncbi:hypothetical protein BDW67DRAFT_189474 [Aspergillus spinulosporus]
MVLHFMHMYPDVRWQALGADAAWNDVFRIFKETDEPVHRMSFMNSLVSTLKIGEQSSYGSLTGDSCVTKDCHMGANSDVSGPAGYLIYNSLVEIHQLHKKYHDGLIAAAALTSFELDLMEDTFAPIPPPEDNEWKLLLLDLITRGALSTAAPWFNNGLKRLPFFLNKNRLDNSKDTAITLIGQSTTIAKDVLPSGESPWTPQKQNNFTAYMGQVIDG